MLTPENYNKIAAAFGNSVASEIQGALTAVLTAGVSSFNGRTGAITFLAADGTGVGLALIASPTFTGVPAAPTAALGTNTTQIATTAFVLANAAPIASPTFTGTPAAPTAALNTNTTQLATTAFVIAQIAAIPAPSGVLLADGSVAGATGAAQNFGVRGIFTDVIKQSTGLLGIQNTLAGEQIIIQNNNSLASITISGTTAPNASKIAISANGGLILDDASFGGGVDLSSTAGDILFPSGSKFDSTASFILLANNGVQTGSITEKSAATGVSIVTTTGTITLIPVTGWGTPTGTLNRNILTDLSTQTEFNQAIMAMVSDLKTRGYFTT